MEEIQKLLGSEVFKLGDVRITVFTIVLAVVIAYMAKRYLK